MESPGAGWLEDVGSFFSVAALEAAKLHKLDEEAGMDSPAKMESRPAFARSDVQAKKRELASLMRQARSARLRKGIRKMHAIPEHEGGGGKG